MVRSYKKYEKNERSSTEVDERTELKPWLNFFPHSEKQQRRRFFVSVTFNVSAAE